MIFHPSCDALQWAIDQLDQEQPRHTRTQEERNHLHELEQSVKAFRKDGYIPYQSAYVTKKLL